MSGLLEIIYFKSVLPNVGISGKAFIARKHMQRHERTHAEIKPIACTICEFRTTRNDKLREHTKVRHPEVALTLGYITAEDLQKRLDKKVSSLIL